jgi:hypothetical protein
MRWENMVVLEGEELQEYQEELDYAVELYGADTISKPYSGNKKLANELKDSPGKIVEGIKKLAKDPRVGQINEKLQDWNARMNEAEAQGSGLGGDIGGPQRGRLNRRDKVKGGRGGLGDDSGFGGEDHL